MYMYQNFKFSLTLLIQIKNNLALNHRSLVTAREPSDFGVLNRLGLRRRSDFTVTIKL